MQLQNRDVAQRETPTYRGGRFSGNGAITLMCEVNSWIEFALKREDGRKEWAYPFAMLRSFYVLVCGLQSRGGLNI